MCTELILAFIYFFTIFVINYFILKLLKNNFSNICYLIKIEKIFQYFSLSSKRNIFYYLIPIIFSLINHNI